MSNRLVTIAAVWLVGGLPLYAANNPKATVSVQCSGKSGAKVTLRWNFMKMFSVPCELDDNMVMPPASHPPEPIVVDAPKSQIEIQTEGGIETSYHVNVTIDSQRPPLNNFIDLYNYGSPSVVSTNAGFTIKRSAGPNKYGEQNFRVTLANAKSTPVKIMAESSGDSSKAQVALRWGHPDFNDHAEFKLWTVKPGPAQLKLFTLNDQKSEFEIQTEGGTGTGYDLSIWIDVGSGFSTQPSIRIIHNKPHHDFDTGTTDITFTPSNGNIYGELNVDVDAPWVQSPASAPPPPSGWAGTVRVCNFSGNATLHLEANLLTPQSSNATGAMTMPSTGATAENDPVAFALQADGSAVGQYKTKQNFYEEGTWKVTAAQVMNGTQKITGPYTPLPFTAQLPGAGGPNLDFTGGTCQIQ